MSTDNAEKPDSIGQRIRKRRRDRKLTQRALAEVTGVDVTTVTRWEKDLFRPDEEKIAQMAQPLGVSAAWIAFGDEGGALRETPAPFMLELSVIGRVEAGAWREAVASDHPISHMPFMPHPSFPASNQVGFEVRGESCNQVARDGDILIVAPYELIPGGVDALIERNPPPLVIAQRVRAGLVEATVKELRYVDGQLELWPKSDHPDHQNKITLNENGDTEEVRITHVVLQAVARYF